MCPFDSRENYHELDNLKYHIYENIVKKKLEKFPESLRYLLTDLYNYNYEYWIEKRHDTIGAEFVRENGFTKNQLDFINKISKDLNDVLDQYEKLLSLAVEVKTENTPEFMEYFSKCNAEHIKFLSNKYKKGKPKKINGPYYKIISGKP